MPSKYAKKAAEKPVAKPSEAVGSDEGDEGDEVFRGGRIEALAQDRDHRARHAAAW